MLEIINVILCLFACFTSELVSLQLYMLCAEPDSGVRCVNVCFLCCVCVANPMYVCKSVSFVRPLLKRRFMRFPPYFFSFVLFVSKFLSGIYRAFEYLHLYSWVKFQSLVSTYMHCIGSSFLSSAVSSALVSIAGITK